MHTGNTLPQISRPAMYHKRAQIHRTERSARRCHVTVHFFHHPCGISSSARTPHFFRIFRSEICCCKSPLLIHPLPLRLYAVIADYSFAADRPLTHLQQHFCISQITYSAGLRRFELHITNWGSPPYVELPFSYALLFYYF